MREIEYGECEKCLSDFAPTLAFLLRGKRVLTSVADPGYLSRIPGQKDFGTWIRIRIKEF
jgi:hypothetical protein